MFANIDHRGSALEITLLALQAFQVAFLWLHDWIPLGRLNNVAAVQSQDTKQHLVIVTFLSSIPFTFALISCGLFFGTAYPPWLYIYLWVIYTGILLGQLQAWWIPYLFKPNARRAARYQIMFANTHSFLARHNGIAPNTLHVILHIATAATLVTLFFMA